MIEANKPGSSVLFVSETRSPQLFLVKALFLMSAVVAPLELNLVAALTVYDLLIMGLAFLLIVSGPKTVHFPPKVFLIAYYIFLLSALLSTFRAPYPLEAMTQTLQFLFIFLVQIPVIMSVAKSPNMLRWGFLFFLGGTLIGMTWAMIVQEEGFHNRLRSFYSDNSNRLGAPTAYLLPIALWLFFESWRRTRSLILIIVALFVFYTMFWAVAASGSRRAAVGTLIALVIFLSFRHGFQVNVKTLFRIVLVVGAVGALGILMYQADYFPSALQERIQRTLDFEESLIEDRRRLAEAGWRAFMESPFVGVGLDNFRYVATQYDVPLVTEQVPHNLWLQFLAQIGLFGTMAFAAIIVCWLLLMFRTQATTRSPAQRELLWACIASMVGLMTIFMFGTIMIQRTYWVVFGLGLAAALHSEMFSESSRLTSEHSTPLHEGEEINLGGNDS